MTSSIKENDCGNLTSAATNDENFPQTTTFIPNNQSSDTLLDTTQTSDQSQARDIITLVALFLINLLNYVDRYTVAGIIGPLKDYYVINDKQTGLIQTVFILAYMVSSPVFGLLGDRFNRKLIIFGGVTFWAAITFLSSFIPPSYFWLFVLLRCLVGIGEASYSTIAPTVISDMFAGQRRLTAMGFFNFAIPLGSGLGFMIGWGLYLIFEDQWQFSLRLSPLIAVVLLIVFFVFAKEPQRGRADGSISMERQGGVFGDVYALLSNKCYLFLTLGQTCAFFAVGSIAWWIVDLVNASINALSENPNAYKAYSISIIFGAITIVSGISGVVIGTWLAFRIRKRVQHSAYDPIICAVGLLIAAPLIFIALLLLRVSLFAAMSVMLLAEIALCLNWAIITDLTMSVNLPNRRATASAMQMIISHALGDAGSPYILGAVSDAVNSALSSSGELSLLDAKFYGLQYAFYINPAACVIGALFFFVCSFYVRDAMNSVRHEIDAWRLNAGQPLSPAFSRSLQTINITIPDSPPHSSFAFEAPPIQPEVQIDSMTTLPPFPQQVEQEKEEQQAEQEVQRRPESTTSQTNLI